MRDAARHLARFLDAAGLTDDPELAGTPERVAELLASFAPSGPPPELSRTSTETTSPVIVRQVPFHSMCVHHLLPFFGHVAVGYRPRGAVVGLGSIPRLVQHFARRLQLQERLADQIADALYEATAAESLAVGIRARHMCVEMRGAASPAEVTVVARRGTADDWLLQRVQDP